MTSETRRPGRPRTLPDLICEQCTATFRPYTSGSRFCSRKCFGAWHSEHRTFRAKKDAKVCPACKETFYVGGEGSRRAQKFCSAECAGKQRAPLARKMSTAERAWLAGLFDGEGSVVFVRRANHKSSLRVCISNTNMELLERILAVTGTGTLVSQKRYAEHHAPAWIWQCYSDNARALLAQMLPWLIVKREKAEMAIAAPRTPRNPRKG